MKSAIMAGLVALGLASGPASAQVPAAQSATKVCTLKVSGMTCSGCSAGVKIAAKGIAGVTEAVVNYEKKSASITYNPAQTSPEAIAKVITAKTGFKAEVPATR